MFQSWILELFSLGYVIVMNSRSLSFVTDLGMCSLDMLQSGLCYNVENVQLMLIIVWDML